ncbi:hypothetical protein [Butyrivibrio sp. WCD2001]|uniref:hypothetical protein n=1 Tax=Butyrivibrio sp. WCD2001 TaxID=1280681 RepID=UPI0018CB1303|nr:hypothetical protein [Butyrivibrio sp. WCD2001]
MDLKVAKRAYLLGHSVATNERYYSHAKSDDLEDVRDLLNKYCDMKNSTDEVGHAELLNNIIDFIQIKSSETLNRIKNLGTS